MLKKGESTLRDVLQYCHNDWVLIKDLQLHKIVYYGIADDNFSKEFNDKYSGRLVKGIKVLSDYVEIKL